MCLAVHLSQRKKKLNKVCKCPWDRGIRNWTPPQEYLDIVHQRNLCKPVSVYIAPLGPFIGPGNLLHQPANQGFQSGTAASRWLKSNLWVRGACCVLRKTYRKRWGWLHEPGLLTGFDAGWNSQSIDISLNMLQKQWSLVWTLRHNNPHSIY